MLLILVIVVFLFFDTTNISNGMNASYVIGQPDFTSGTADVTQSLLNYPRGMVYDSTNNRLFVGDDGNVRVMVFDTTTIINGEDAINVLGQSDFTSNNIYTTQDGLSSEGLAFDSTNNRLYVADQSNNRIMIFGLIKNTADSFSGGTVGTSYSQTLTTS